MLKKISITAITFGICVIIINSIAMGLQFRSVLERHPGEQAVILAKMNTYNLICVESVFDAESILPLISYYVWASNDHLPHFLIAFPQARHVSDGYIKTPIEKHFFFPSVQEERPVHEYADIKYSYIWSYREWRFVPYWGRSLNPHRLGMGYDEVAGCKLHQIELPA